MHNTRSLAKRILSQFVHDKGALVLLFVTPIITLLLLGVLFSSEASAPRIATVHLPSSFQTALEQQDVRIQDVAEIQAERLLDDGDVDAVLRIKDGTTLSIKAEGSDPSKTAAVVNVVYGALNESREKAAEAIKADLAEQKNDLARLFQEAQGREDAMKAAMQNLISKVPSYLRAQAIASIAGLMGQGPSSVNLESLSVDVTKYMAIQDTDISYLHGNENRGAFDYYGPVVIGLLLFVFVFLTTGISLMNERGFGALSRFLATPVKATQVAGGYTLGFGLPALIQTGLILWLALAFVGFPNEGNVFLVVLAGVLITLVSMTLGLFVSSLASSSFRIIHLMLLFMIPQILLCGLFDLSGSPAWLQTLSGCLPLTQGVDALRAVMLQGATLADLTQNLLVLTGYIVVFFLLTAWAFRKKRAKGSVA